MDNATTLNNGQDNMRTNNRKGSGYRSGDEGVRGGTGGNSRSSLGRKVAVDAINNSSGSTMGASVYIADTITNTINFNF
nr:MAG: hypothetical protein 2 [Gammacarmovirus sp.]